MRLTSKMALSLLVAAGLGGGAARADGVIVNYFNKCCPPCWKHWFEGPPKIKFKPGCPKPICDPCNLEHFGYYPACWSPWPYPPDWSHCLVPPPAAQVPPHPGRPPAGMEPRYQDPPMALPGSEQPPPPRPNLDMSMAVPLYQQ